MLRSDKPTDYVRFYKTILEEFYQKAFRKKIYISLEQLQADLDLWMESYNKARSHGGRCCLGKSSGGNFPGFKETSRAKNARPADPSGSTDNCAKPWGDYQIKY